MLGRRVHAVVRCAPTITQPSAGAGLLKHFYLAGAIGNCPPRCDKHGERGAEQLEGRPEPLLPGEDRNATRDTPVLERAGVRAAG